MSSTTGDYTSVRGLGHEEAFSRAEKGACGHCWEGDASISMSRGQRIRECFLDGSTFRAIHSVWERRRRDGQEGTTSESTISEQNGGNILRDGGDGATRPYRAEKIPFPSPDIEIRYSLHIWHVQQARIRGKDNRSPRHIRHFTSTLVIWSTGPSQRLHQTISEP